MPVEVKAPYNFVPLNKKVFFPPWADWVTHDIPFENGLSGQIELEITAETPIFIRKPYEEGDPEGSYYQNQNGERISKKFCHIKDKNGNKRYYIPGSSVKGEISNVLEILSFSKLQFFNDIKYSQREWDNGYLYPKTSFANVKGGWLSLKENGDYLLKYNDEKNPGRIHHQIIDNTVMTDNSDKFLGYYSSNGFDKNARKKYELTNSIKKGIVTFITKKFQCSYNNTLFKNICQIASAGGNDGTIVFTGQSSKNSSTYGKKSEFIFWKPNKNAVLNPDDIRIKSFKAAYYDGDSTRESIDWKMWKNQLKNGGKVPVFITIENGKVKHFGLSQLYKLPYDNSIGDIVTKYQETEHFSNSLDFIESLFGTIDEKKLKGRVHFSHAFSKDNCCNEHQEITTVLGNPKATYYPFYVKQNFRREDPTKIIGNNYNTLKNSNAEIAGRKRYPIVERNEEHFSGGIFDMTPSNVTTTFTPLSIGSKFKTKINFHNLLPEELGGLLSAISFHGDNKYRHSLGMAKPLGFGVVKMEIKKLQIENEVKTNEIDNYLCLFESLMNEFLVQGWKDTEQIKELFAIATPVTDKQNKLSYLQLNIGGGNNVDEFKDIKNDKKALPRYSQFMNVEVEISSKIDETCEHKNYKEYDIKEMLQKKKNECKEQFSSIIQKVQDKISSINQADEISNGIDLSGITRYGVLKDKLEIYDSEFPFTNEQIVKQILDKLDEIFNKFKGKKKKQFINDSKKLEKIISWIGKEKAKEWFNSKKQQ